MNEESLQWLKDISTTTGISYSGDRTITTDFANELIDYIKELEQLREKIKSLKTRIKTIKRRRKKQTSLIRKYKEEITKRDNALNNKNEVIKKVRQLIKEEWCYDEETKTFCHDINYDVLPKLLQILEQSKGVI